MSGQDVTNSLMVLWIFHQQKTNTARDAPQSAAALNIPVRGWCQSAYLSHQARPPLSPRLHLSSSPPSDFSASLWQVISCCRGNITGRPAGFTLVSGILPWAVLCVNTQRSLAGFWLPETPRLFSKESTVRSHPPVSARAVMNLWWFIFRRQTNKAPPSFSLLFMLLLSCSNRLCNPHVLVRRMRFLLMTVSNQRLDGKHRRRSNNSGCFA